MSASIINKFCEAVQPDTVTGDKAHQRLRSGLIGCGLEVLTVRTRLAGPNVREEASATSFGEIVALSHGRC